MFRLALTGLAFFALALPAMAQDAEVGQEYEITIESAEDNPYTGPTGQTMIGEVVFRIPDAEAGETYTVTVTAIRSNQYTGETQASCEYQQVDGDRVGMCDPAP